MTRPSAKAWRAGMGPGNETWRASPSRSARAINSLASGPEPTSVAVGAWPRLARQRRDRVDQRVDALGGAQFADIEEVGRVLGRRRGDEFLGR